MKRTIAFGVVGVFTLLVGLQYGTFDLSLVGLFDASLPQEMVDTQLSFRQALSPASSGDCDGDPTEPLCCFVPWLCDVVGPILN